MKVVQIVTQMEAAGAQKVAYLLHEGLKERGQQSELWFLYTKRAAYTGLDGVRSLFDHPAKSKDYAVIATRLFWQLRAHRPDVVITHTHYSNVLAQPIARAAGVRRRIAVHHNPLPTYPASARIADRILGGSGVYSGVVAVSETVANTLRSNSRRYLELVTTIRNGLVFPQCDPSLDARTYCGVPIDAPLLVNVGRLSKQKNHALLLRALRDVRDAHLAIIGGGELRQHLEDLARELSIESRVHFLGEVASGVVASFLNQCDVFVFPSLWEGLPMAAIEALHAGAAIVASDIPATREVAGNAAMLVPPDDAPALAEAIGRVLHDSDLSRTLRQRARHRAARFTANNMINGYYRLIFGEPLDGPDAGSFSNYN